VAVTQPTTINRDQEYELLREAAQRAKREMLRVGNLLNWPPELPVSYAHAINALRYALGETVLQPPEDGAP
jgi:hypothetical protein